MSDLSAEIKKLTEKAVILVEKYQSIQTVHIELQNKYEQLKNEMDIQKDEYLKLQEENKQLRITKSLASNDSPEDAEEVKKMLTEYIKEIDRCIALLND